MIRTAQPILDPADRDLAGRVAAFLASRHWPGLRRLQVEAHNGRVTLRGSVQTFYEKQLAQQAARRVAGVVTLIDGVGVTGHSNHSRTKEGRHDEFRPISVE